MQDAVPTQGAFLTLSGISKRYGGVRALEDVDFACERGKIHAVLGENGAGKSTLIKIIAGVVQPDAGGMRLAGNDVNPADDEPVLPGTTVSLSIPEANVRLVEIA
jgi:ribose transport system ATP-binding protein